MQTNLLENVKRDLDEVMDDIRRLQTRIAGSAQPASQIELYELQRLGRRYGTLMTRLQILLDDQATHDRP